MASPLCRCRNCGDKYHEARSRALPGYCTKQCQSEAARRHGYRKKKAWEHPTEEEVLKSANKVGIVYVTEDD